ncbi:hypothetical protein SAMN02746065_10426 [Desulfocicer vacuolatum DSM 3385]|uniref:Uncharacterized protein n=1 Tax=Desulfocicer vacuolatum DSM 3385 TaxID=1121400 RepID=A0A1W2A1Q3_9BACT|nr:hypothetical protein [Desulfocicer vacuolatum]SMC54570.1 hypothetical protein SAMN02746065_10426 [Desulfocicer vacuolatum DSM 3385]
MSHTQEAYSQHVSRNFKGTKVKMSAALGGYLKKQIIYLLGAIAVLWSSPVHIQAHVDQMQLDLLTHYELPLRWDNIENQSQLLAGPDPEYSMEYGMHIIPLEPGESVKVKIPENSTLRIVSPDGCTPLDPLKISISNGTGLHAFQKIPMTPDRLAGLVVPPTDDPAMCRISLPLQEKTCITMALFTLRQEPLSSLAPHRTRLCLNGDPVTVSQNKVPGTQRFWQVGTNVPRQLTLEGPVRIAIETRLLYPAPEQSRGLGYFVNVAMDDTPFATLNFETPPETSKQIFMDGTPLVCGRMQRAFLTVPRGKHTLTLHSRAGLIARVLKQDNPDYLFSHLNAPISYEQTRDKLIRAAASIPTGDKGVTDKPTLSEIEITAQKTVRDNARPQGGLSGAFSMDEQAKKRPDAPGVQKAAKKLYAAHTFFRDLLPFNKPDRDDQQSFRFILPRLKRRHDHHMTVARQHEARLLSLIQESSFVKIPSNDKHPLVYRLPTRNAPSTLRIIIAPRNVSQTFFIKFNNTQSSSKDPVSGKNRVNDSQETPPHIQGQQTMIFTVAPCYEAASQDFRISPAEAGLALQRLRESPLNHLQNHEFIRQNVKNAASKISTIFPSLLSSEPDQNNVFPWPLYPETLIKPAFIELPLPVNVDRFTLWGENTTAMAAVQYRDSLPHRMGESEYLQALKTVGSSQDLFTDFVAFLSSDPGKKDKPDPSMEMIKTDLNHHWTPLVRLIRANDALFRGGQGGLFPDPGSNRISRARITAITEKANALEAEDQPLQALEKWSALFANSTGKIRARAGFKMVDQLILLGESYLAETFLRQLFLKSPPKVSHEAFQRLVTFYRNGKSPKKHLPLYAANAMQYPTADNFKILAEQLFEDGHFFHAMMLATVIPCPVKPTDLLLKTAGRLGWFKVYMETMKEISLPRKMAWWQAQMLLYQGQYRNACEALENAGDKGKAVKKAVIKGMAIKASLFSKDKEKRIQGILDWESWSNNLPGDYAWQNAGDGVLDYDGAVMTRSKPRNLYARAFRATPSKSVKARFYGPFTLKVTARLLHEKDNSVPVNNWFSITHNTTCHDIPIVNNLPAQGLSLVGENSLVPGQSVSREINLGPGINEVEINTPAMPLIVSFDLLRPVMPLAGVLPVLNIDNVAAVMKNAHVDTSASIHPRLHICITEPCDERRPSPGLPTKSCTPHISNTDKFLHSPHKTIPCPSNKYASLFTASKIRNLLKIEAVLSIDRIWSSREKNNPVPSKAHGAATPDTFFKDDPWLLPYPTWDSPETVTISAVAVSPVSWEELNRKRRDIPEHAKLPLPAHKKYPGEKEKIFNHMATLVKAARKTPENLLSIEAEAQDLFSRHSHLPGLGALLGQITRQTAWKPVTTVQADAGITRIPMEKWQPESRQLRVRKALFPEVFKGEQVITRENDLVFFMKNTTPAMIKATVSAMDLPILQPAPVTLFYQIDDLPPKIITLMPGVENHEFSAPVARGEHRLTLGIVAGYANQLLRVSFCETTPKSRTCADVTLDTPPRRAFYTATHDAPVVVNIQGPAWIRIDQQKQQETRTRHQYIEKGWQRLVLTPDKAEKQALYRIHRRWKKSTPTDPPNVRPVKIQYDALPAPHKHFQWKKPVENIWFHDAYPLGSQEDGTWSLSAGYKKPFSRQEDDDVASQDHQYEISATHYYHAENLPGYFKTSFLSRFIEQGGATLGIKEDFFHYPDQSSLGFNIKSSLYMQKPDASRFDFFQSPAGEYAGFIKARIFQKRSLGPKSYHMPAFSLFGRVLSMDDLDKYPDHRTDSDVFSSYKKDHKTGVSLTEYAAFKPWLDTVWFLRGGINSNEDFNIFNPDNVKIQVGWKQLFGNLNAHLAYRNAYYFADNDRDNDIKRNHVDLDLTWHQWMCNQRRFTLGLEFSQDLDNNESAVLFSLSWFFSRGRGLKDIRPGDLDFYSIHKRDIPQTENNRIWRD